MAGRVHPSLLEQTPKALSFKKQGSSSALLKRQASVKGGPNEAQHEQMTQMAELVRANTNKNLKRQQTSTGVSQGQESHQDHRADGDMPRLPVPASFLSTHAAFKERRVRCIASEHECGALHVRLAPWAVSVPCERLPTS
jgi:hypothetical protein